MFTNPARDTDVFPLVCRQISQIPSELHWSLPRVKTNQLDVTLGLIFEFSHKTYKLKTVLSEIVEFRNFPPSDELPSEH